MKIHKILLPVAIFIAILTAAEKGQNSYVIEADGEFGKELKELVEKYASDENATIKVYQKQNGDDENRRLINIGVNKGAIFNVARGEELYNKNCRHCHGEKGTKRAMGQGQKLSKMSGEDIAAAMSAYNADPEYGGQLKYIMQPMARNVSYAQLGDIIAFLKGEEVFLGDAQDSQNADISTKPTKQGSYLE